MKSFLNACGIKDSLRITIEGPGATGGEPRQFPQPFAVIGRDDRADLILEEPQVSRRHVYLQAVGGWLFWVDLESRTGTRTETGLRKSGWLAGRGFIGIGPYVVRRPTTASGGDSAFGELPRDTPLAAQAFGREPLPEVALEFLNGPSQSMLWPMHRVMSLIGSAKGCKFRLTDPSVSAFHASLLRTPAGLWIVDLRGGCSITVNAVPVRTSPLADGDMLGIGRYRVRIQCRERARDPRVWWPTRPEGRPSGRSRVGIRGVSLSGHFPVKGVVRSRPAREPAACRGRRLLFPSRSPPRPRASRLCARMPPSPAGWPNPSCPNRS